MGKQRERARSASSKLAAAAGAKVEPALAPLRCPSVPLPDVYKRSRDAEQAHGADRAAAEALYRKLGAPSRALDAWVARTSVTSGALLTVATP